MGKHGKNNKRKKSSETGSDKQKVAKHGGQSASSSVSSVGDTLEIESDIVTVSQLLKTTNDVLYNDDLNMSSISVFEAASGIDDRDSMSKGGPSSSAVGSDLPKEPTNADILSYLVQMNTKFSSKIGDIEIRLKNLESLDIKVADVDKDLKKMWLFMQDSQKKVEERVNSLEDKHDSINFNVGATNDKITQLEKERDAIKGDLVYLQSQSMRSNLLFAGIEEAPNEVPEQTEQTLRNFMETHLKMAKQEVDEIGFDRVHRIGQRVSGKSRSIVAKFTVFKDRETVRRLRVKLNDTQFYINEQFPREIVEKRKLLFPKLKAAKRENKKAWIVYDKLYIDGKMVNDKN